MIKLLLIAALVLSLWGVNYPFAGGYNANNNYLALAAKNYYRFGFLRLRFFPTYFAGETLPARVPYYLHHPILLYPLTALPYSLFGFENWVVHVTNFLFLIGGTFLIYKIGCLVWGRKIGMWAAALAAIFPMTTFFWKYILFETGSLFFNLCIIYFFLRYQAVQKRLYLVFIVIFTLLSGLFDWGVLYLVVPFLVFYKQKFVKPYIAYVAAAGVSIGAFIVSVYLLQGGFTELRQAIGVHGYTAVLTTLPFWPLRLVLITLVRFIIYLTPLSILWIPFRKSRVLLFFFLYGVMNIVVLPTVTWEDSFFLYYFVPFFAFSGALWFSRHRWWWVIPILVWSAAVNYFKLEQIKKQFWQYDAAKQINTRLAPYEKVGSVDFAGDILEQYFYHPTQPMYREDIPEWQVGAIYKDISKVVVSGSLITRKSVLPAPQQQQQSHVLQWYRAVRDFFIVGQL